LGDFGPGKTRKLTQENIVMKNLIQPNPELRAAAEQVNDLDEQVRTVKTEIARIVCSDDDLDEAAAKLSGLRARLELLESRRARRRDGLRDQICCALRGEHFAQDLKASHCNEVLRQAKQAAEAALVRTHGPAGRAMAKQQDSLDVQAARRALREAEQVRDRIHDARRRIDASYEAAFAPKPGEEWRTPHYVQPDFEAALDAVLDGLLAEPPREGPLKRALKKIVAAA
jgi:hypothetical protein